jgi:hypothetical protein
MEVIGAPWPGPADPQSAPKNGTSPRVDVAKAVGRIATLPHRVLAYRGADGFPVIVPVQIAGHDRAGRACQRRRASARKNSQAAVTARHRRARGPAGPCAG